MAFRYEFRSSLFDLFEFLSLMSSKKTQIKPLRGFDRLAAAGFSEEDIANFRRTFHSQSTSDYLDGVGEDDDCK